MNDRRNVAYAEKQPKSTVCRLTKEREREKKMAIPDAEAGKLDR